MLGSPLPYTPVVGTSIPEGARFVARDPALRATTLRDPTLAASDGSVAASHPTYVVTTPTSRCTFDGRARNCTLH